MVTSVLNFIQEASSQEGGLDFEGLGDLECDTGHRVGTKQAQRYVYRKQTVKVLNHDSLLLTC